jgi:hypothetical protein
MRRMLADVEKGRAATVIHIQDLLAQPACRYLGWALLHFLWQGTLAAVVLVACHLGFRESPARDRYAVSCLFLIVLLALLVLTFTAYLIPVPVFLTTPARVQYRQSQVYGVDAAFIRRLGESGIKNLSIDQLVRLKQSGF